MARLEPHLDRARIYLEPFVGGGSVALAVAQRYADLEIVLADADPNVADFWSVLIGCEATFLRLLRLLQVPPCMSMGHRVRHHLTRDPFLRAYQCLFINRVTFSGGVFNTGLLARGTGDGIRARYNAADLARCMIAARAALRGRTTVHSMDVMYSLHLPFDVVYLDPPYIAHGANIYRASMCEHQHRVLGDTLKRLRRPWLLSYDDQPLVRDLYQGCRIETVSVPHWVRRTMKRKKRVELLIEPTGGGAQ